MYKHAIVINGEGYKAEFVLVEVAEADDQQQELPISYTLADGESLIYTDVEMALSMLKPRWNGAVWIETATPEEIEEARPKPLDPSTIPPSNEELAEQNLMLMEVAADLYEQNLVLQEQGLQTMEAVAELFEMMVQGGEVNG